MIIAHRSFLAYNWQEEQENTRRYKISQPPEYRPDRVQVPVVLFWSDRDVFASEADVERLEKELPHLKNTNKLSFNHIDYLWGKNAYSELYLPICDALKNFRI